MTTSAGVDHDQLTPFRTEWLDIGLGTEPADRERAERAVVAAYSALGLPPPPVVVWAQSPFAGHLAAQLIHAQIKGRPLAPRLRRLRRRLTARARRRLTPQTWSIIETHLQPVEDKVWEGVALPAAAAVRSVNSPGAKWLKNTWDLVRAQAADRLSDEDPCAVWERLWPAPTGLGDGRVSGGSPPVSPCYGNHEAGWLAHMDAASRIVGEDQRLQPLAELARSSGWWWPTTNAVVLSDRPSRLECDDEGRLHCEDGAALVYRDGWSLHAWHGVGVAKWVIEQPERIRLPMILSQPDVAMQRVLLERYGYQRFTQDLGSEVHSDDWGKLWRAPLFLDEPLVMVQVLNATPEPDGTFKDYFLRVPPWVTSAREAVAWTFAATADSYEPEVQT